MANDRKNLDSLIDSIGQIDDRFIHEAENVTSFTFAGFRKRKRRLIPVLTAATLCCAFLLVSALSVLRPPAGSDRHPGDVSSSSVGKTGDPLEISLLSLTAKEIADHRIDGNGLFLDGKCRLVWSYGDGNYYAVTVTNRDDLRRLGSYLSDPNSIVPADKAEDSGLRFWICTGDGVSATPYLLYGAWGVGNLFDYNPETAPSSDFASFLTKLIQKNLA